MSHENLDPHQNLTPSHPPGGPTGAAEDRRSRDDAEPGGPPGQFSTSPLDDLPSLDEPDDFDPLLDAFPAVPPPLSGRGARPTKPVSRANPPLAKPSTEPVFTPEQRLLILDAWRRSGLPAGDFAPLVGVSRHTLYAWQKRFRDEGPAGLADKTKGGPVGSKLPEATRRAILMLKEQNPDWGCQRISDALMRGPGFAAGAAAVARVLHEAGYQSQDVPTKPHAPKEVRFERARPNQLWQTDLFTFILKRQNRRVYLVAFLDDCSRFVVGYGLHASQSTSLVIEVFRAAVGGFGTPEEVRNDNGTQYVTWRGTSAFRKELDALGVKQVVASPHRPQTLGKIERFWGTLWRECVATSVFADLGDARVRIGHFIDHYNFHRPHQGIDGSVPADRFFGADSEVRRALESRVQANARDLARDGVPKSPFYLAGQAGGRGFSVHAEGERVILTDAAGRREIDLVPPKEEVGAVPMPVCPQAVPIGPDVPTGVTVLSHSLVAFLMRFLPNSHPML